MLFVLLSDFCLFEALSIILPQVYSHGQQTIVIIAHCLGYQLTIALAIARRRRLLSAHVRRILHAPLRIISTPLQPLPQSITLATRNSQLANSHKMLIPETFQIYGPGCGSLMLRYILFYEGYIASEIFICNSFVMCDAEISYGSNIICVL